jgi:hypothetical protein
MRRAAVAVVGAVLLVLTVSPALAGRPLETEDTGTLEPGTFEVELSGDYTRHPGEDLWILRGVLNAGILPRLEAKLELPFLLLESDSGPSHGGFGDTVLGVKYRVLDERAIRPAVAGALALRLLTGDADRGLGAEGADLSVLGVVGKTIGPFILHGNVGYTFVTADRDLDVWTLAASAQYRVTATLALVGEALGGLSTHRNAPHAGRARGGFTYAVRDNIKLDASVGHGFTRAGPGLLVTIGVTIGF